MYIPYEFQHRSNRALFTSYANQPGIENQLIHAITEALNSIHDQDQQLDFFLGANAATVGSFYHFSDAIKLISNRHHKDLFVVYWHMCAQHNRMRLVDDWVIRWRKDTHELNSLEQTMREMLNHKPVARSVRNEMSSIDDFDQSSVAVNKPYPHNALNYYNIMKISCLTLAAVGVIALGFGLVGSFATLPWLSDYTVSVLITSGASLALGAGVGFFMTLYQEHNDLSLGNHGLSPRA